MKEPLKRVMITLVFLIALHQGNLMAQDPITLIIKEGITKVIVAVDLKIQRLQNETIWLQNAQKTLENTMSKLKLEEISSWVEKQRAQYDAYFQELWTVKNTLLYYHKVKKILDLQKQLVHEYQQAWALFRNDIHFETGEISYMFEVYSGMIKESLQHIDQLLLVVQSFHTQMSDAGRMEIIDQVYVQIEKIHADLRQFNRQQQMISLQRAHEKASIELSKKLSGLQ